MGYVDAVAAFAAANRICAMRPESENETAIPSKELDIDAEKSDGIKVELEEVYFRYPTREVPVLKGLSMAVSIPYSR